MVLIKNFLAPKITSLKCVGLEWESQENLATWLVYHLPNAAEDALLPYRAGPWNAPYG